MANIFVYGGVGIAAGVLLVPNRQAPNLTRISCLSQEDERHEPTIKTEWTAATLF